MDYDLINQDPNLQSSNDSDKRNVRKERSCNEQTSPEVLAALRNGSHEAYTEIYLHYQKPVCDFLTALTHSPEAAEDITHDVFISVWEKRGKIDPRQGIRRYLFAIAKRQAMRYFRKQKTEAAYFQKNGEQSPSDFTPEELMEAKEIDALIEADRSRMPRIRGQIFGMFYDEGLSYSLIADKLGMNKATVANHLSNAKNQLRKILALYISASLIRYSAGNLILNDIVSNI